VITRAVVPERYLKQFSDALWAHFGPVLDARRSRGVLRAAPVSACLVLTSLLATAWMFVPGPWQDSARAVWLYSGASLYHWQLWKVPASGLLAMGWMQWLWTLLMGLVVFAALEVRIGPVRTLVCAVASHCLPTILIALAAPLVGNAAELTYPDYGTSCLVVGAAAALAEVRRSAWLTAIIMASLLADVVLSAPSTTVEHWLSAATGAVVALGAEQYARIGRTKAGRLRASSRSLLDSRELPGICSA